MTTQGTWLHSFDWWRLVAAEMHKAGFAYHWLMFGGVQDAA
jgi:hypothetical protein